MSKNNAVSRRFGLDVKPFNLVAENLRALDNDALQSYLAGLCLAHEYLCNANGYESAKAMHEATCQSPHTSMYARDLITLPDLLKISRTNAHVDALVDGALDPVRRFEAADDFEHELETLIDRHREQVAEILRSLERQDAFERDLNALEDTQTKESA